MVMELLINAVETNYEMFFNDEAYGLLISELLPLKRATTLGCLKCPLFARKDACKMFFTHLYSFLKSFVNKINK